MKLLCFLLLFVVCISAQITTSEEWITNEQGVTLKLAMQIQENTHVYASEMQGFLLKDEVVKGLGETVATFPRTELYFDEGEEKEVPVYTGAVEFLFYKPYTETSWEWTLSLTYQACSETMCFAPETLTFSHKSINAPQQENASKNAEQDKDTLEELIQQKKIEQRINILSQYTIRNYTIGYRTVKQFINFLNNETDDTETTDYNSIDDITKDSWEDYNIILILFLVLIGGFALNLTPCVLPMIPINLAILGAGKKATTKRQGFILGFIYGIGLTLAYGTLGILVLMTGAQFGEIQSTAIFNFFMTILFIVLALAMFDILHIDFSRYMPTKTPQLGKYATALFMGIVTALLAGSCVAPVVFAVLLYAGKLYLKTKLALLLPLLLGFGMALPWPFLGASLAFLPKPGKWSIYVKRIFAIIILALSLYHGYIAINLVFSTPQNLSFDDELQNAVKQNKPILLKFSASWCKNCKTMDKTTLQNQKVQEQLASYAVITYHSDQYNNPETKSITQYFQNRLELPTFGLPTYIILIPEQKD